MCFEIHHKKFQSQTLPVPEVYQVFPAFGRFFRARHGSRLVCMSLTLKVNTKGDTGTVVLRLDAATPIGSGLISLAHGMFLMNLTLAKMFQTQKMMPKLWPD